jgi:hypothetical protein
VASQSAGGLYRQSDRRRSAKLVPTLAGRGVLRGQRYDPKGRISVHQTQNRHYFFIQVAPQFTSRG